MNRFYTALPGQDLALLAARLVMAQAPMLADAVLLLPTRRSVLAMRGAFRRLTGEHTVLLPRMLSLADIGEELPGLIGAPALDMLAAIPPAMAPTQRLYMLAAQVQRFEASRGSRASLTQALALAQQLADLQDRAIRAQVQLTPENLEALFPGDYARHWQQSLAFLNIVAQHWPPLEEALGQTTAAAREVRMLTALADYWALHPPGYPVFAIGSTGSQPATRHLLRTIAAMPQGQVVLPGLDPRIHPDHWAAVDDGHPYAHLKTLLDEAGLAPDEVALLGEAGEESPWLSVLQPVEFMHGWAQEPTLPHAAIRLCACAHAEEEARIIALSLREALENGQGNVALITPDEGLMGRVDAHLLRYAIRANRLSTGTLAQSPTGSAWLALLEAAEAPESLHPLLHLLRHPLLKAGDGWDSWLTAFERAARGVSTHAPGQLPGLPAALRGEHATRVGTLSAALLELARARLSASDWLARCAQLLSQWMQPGEGEETISTALEALVAADMFGPLELDAFAALLRQALDAPWRGPQFNAHPRLFMLTPVEARLQHFEHVVLGNMQDAIWPGERAQSPWLNLAQQAQLGLPNAKDHAALMAHDVLMLASAPSVLLTWRQRDGGSPTQRSRYVERLVARLAAQGVEESALVCVHYKPIATALDAAAAFAPAQAPQPCPAERPSLLPVSALDRLFSDPYSLYARYLLRLRPLDALDAEPEARDFGIIAHSALRQLSEHWNIHATAPDSASLHAMATQALAAFAKRPNVQLFWQPRLIAALEYVNVQEALRRESGMATQSELPVKGEVALANGNLVLEGRIDRLEEGESRQLVDYKTGAPPTTKDMQEGRAVQLIAYAMLLAAQGRRPDALEYWGLPSGKRDGAIQWLAWDDATAAPLETALCDALAVLMDPQTPLLARPLSGDRQVSDYDGISRYDEWAG